MGVEDVMKEVSEELERLVSTKTVVGEAMEAGGKTIIPISKVSFGFGSGGGEGKKSATESGFGGGGGAGAKIEPVAFLVISEEDVKLLRVSGKGDIDKFIEAVPEIIGKVKGMKGKMKDSNKPGETQEQSPTEEENN
ncbi:GerW family sporulation protein [Methanohalophilus halophilus]|uniref:Sporulation protein n=1 Tax=Methanohalophilus halophilus TaxID=2177 RepID=A0A1L3Q499_9EURY|nr:spore germination protein GerW family protein [Methanohalophilus halophilus]APH39601.1 sporulation protein [Methanohalophilus halophilus]RNI09064.1 sporulation protein [Methanohalophilus halophilus]SDW32513.1 sporulation protein YtfJ [Methanohalophilus halophilus]